MGSEESIRGSRSDERGLRLLRSKMSWWEQLHHFYVLIALAGIVGSAFVAATIKETVLLAFISMYVLIIAFFAAWSVYTNGAKARYAEGAPLLHGAMHSLRDLRVLMRSEKFHAEPQSLEVLEKTLGRALASFRACLTLATSTVVECRIELIQRPKGTTNLQDLTTYPLVRDSESSAKREHQDNNAKTDPHRVTLSTPYMYLVGGEHMSYYFCGDIAGHQDFHCEYFRRFPHDVRPRSMIVWPIRYRRQPPGGNGHGRSEEIVGFLHAESGAKKAFTRKYDVELGAAMADSLFDIVFDHVRHRKDIEHAIFTDNA